MLDDADAFWAAKQVAAFTDEEIRAIVRTGRYSDARAEAWVADSLIERRKKLVAAWFSRVLPHDRIRVEDGRLAFDELGARHGVTAARSYNVEWSVFDNHRHERAPLAGASGVTLPRPPAGAEYLAATVSCGEGCGKPIVVYLKCSNGGFRVVGIDR
jgi:hypothetical protein